MKKVFLSFLIAALSVGAIFGISVILFGVMNDLVIRVLLSTAIIFGYSIAGLCCSTIYEKEKTRSISLFGMTICLISCIYCLILVIFNNFLYDWRVLFTAILLSLSSGHISLLLLIDTDDEKVRNLQLVTILLSLVSDIFLLALVFLDIGINWKFFAIMGILIALGTIVTPIMNKISKNSNKVSTSDNTPQDDKYAKLEQLKKLLDSNAITEAEYNAEKEKILNQ